MCRNSRCRALTAAAAASGRSRLGRPGRPPSRASIPLLRFFVTANPLAPAWLAVPADANALAPHVWPPGATRTSEGSLTIGGVSATELAAKYGTPLYVLDESAVRERAREAQD